MKRNRFKMLWGLMLSIVLLAFAAVPFVALAQSGAKPADKPDVKAAQSEAGTIRLSGVIDGRGVFVFHGNTVEYRHEAHEQPTGISINGKSWDDLTKPFELGFVPDFGKAVIVEKQGRNRVELTPGKESFSLLIDDTDSSIGVYYVTIDTTGKAPRSATPEGSPRRTPGTALERERETRAELDSLIRSLEGTPGVSEAQLEMLRKRMARADREIENMQRQAQPRNNTARNDVSAAADVSVTTKPDQNGEISITIDGNIRENGHFTFLGNTISYEPREDYLKKTTMTITVNGKPWSITNSKCTLDITPDFEKAAIVEKQGQKSVMLIPGKDRIELYVGGFDSMDQKCHVKIALKNQIPRGNTRSVWIATSSPEPSEKPDEPQELRLMLSGSFFNRDAFTFEGNTVRYRNEDGEEARDVRINYLPWRDLSRPFELDFTPDFDKASILPVQELQERTTITLEAESDKFELVLDHAIKDKSYYKFVRLAVKDQVDRRLVRSVHGSAPVRMPIVNGGFGPQPMPDFGFPNMSLDMNRMPKSGRPAFEESNNRTMFPGAAPSRSGAADPAENKEITLTLEGNFSGYDTFYFKGQSISYQQQKLAYQREPRPLPTDVKINGVPWDDLSKPFELGYTPDFPRAVVLEEVAPYAAGLSRSTTQLQLHFNHPGPPSGYYRFKIAMKDQLRREPEGGFNPFGIMFRAASVDGPTDGMLHPATAVTRPIYPRDTHDSARVEVRGTVDRKAGFRLENGNTIVYQNYETDPERTAPEDPVVLFDGKFASEVTLSDTRDQKAWTNLSIPKGNPGSTAGPGGGGSAMFSTSKTTHFIFRGDDCDYVYFEHDGVMEIIVTNKTDRPAKFQFIMWNGGDKVFEDNDMQYAPVFGPQTKTDTGKGGNPAGGTGGASLAPPPPLLSPAPPVPPNHKTAAEAQAEIEAAASAAAGLPAGKFPTIMNGPMMVTSIKEPTDGMDHPDYTVTSPVRAPRFRPEEKIVVKGTVAMEAGFRIQGDRLHYLNFYAIGGAVSGSNLRIYDGRFASGVTVNGKPWTNLTRPFDLDVSLTPTTGKYIGFKAEHCEYDYQFHHDFIEIRITNKKREPAPFELTLWLFDNPAAQKGRDQQANAAQTQFGAENAADDTDEDDVNDGRKTTRGDFHYNGLSDVIYVRKEANGIRLEYGLNGMNDLQEQKVGDRQLPDPSFRFLGGYDMDKDHRVDIVAWRTVENDSGKHIEVGYGKSGNMDDWHVIGMLGVPDDVEWDLYCGNLSGHWDRNSILWHSPSLGTMGYWPDGKGVESWITIPGEYKGPEWKILGLGDFTGAKKPRDSVLLRFGPNTIATVSANGKYTNLGWLGEDWKVVAIDDFSNDGCDDLILFNAKLRQVHKWEDGKSSKSKSVGSVDAGTAIEGAGDYDGDGWTDLLVRQPGGAMGYFQKADLNKFVPFGYKKDPSWIVIP